MSRVDFTIGRFRLPELSKRARSAPIGLAPIVVFHVAALAILYLTEWGFVHSTLALTSWVLLNFTFLMILRRPGVSAALSLALMGLLILLSKFKFGVLWLGITFLDFLIIDPDTFTFLLAIMPRLQVVVLIGIAAAIPALIAIWRIDPYRVGRRISAGGGAMCAIGLGAISLMVPEQPWEPFQGVNHISNFFRSAATDISGLFGQGFFDADVRAAGPLPPAGDNNCRPQGKPPHIILLLDESSFDITRAPGIKVPAGYREHFRSFDGKRRSLVVEASGGPTWYAEYNVLTGLSARSFGRFQFYVTRIAAERVERGLPRALRRCGYKTVTLYPAAGAFLSARRFQTGTGIEHFIDQGEMDAADDMQPDRYYLDQVQRVLERKMEGHDGPLFVFAYVTANHFPWTTIYRPDLTPDWRGPGNDPAVDEYIRRQHLSARDYAEFVASLKQKFPNESFLLVRFGDHQPAISARLIDPSLGDKEISRKIRRYDSSYFTTYYAIDTINLKPVNVSSALDRLEAPYLPLVVLEAAGLPLDASFTEQKSILKRCQGTFYSCAGGAEARRFNRLLIDAGLIKDL
jgi:Sulfatase